MPFSKKYKDDFFLNDNDCLQLTHDYSKKNKIGKITGTKFAAILNQNEYCSPLKAWTMIMGLYYQVIDPLLEKIGKAVEPKLIKYAEEKLGCKYVSYDPKKINYDVFKNYSIFGGIPDAEPVNDKNIVDYSCGSMLEIKTTSIDKFLYKYNLKKNNFELQKDKFGKPIISKKNENYKNWFSHGKVIIPKNYLMQLGLYLYLREQKSGLFVITFLTVDDYLYPEKFDLNDHEILLEKFEINLEKFSKYIDYTENWYKKYVITKTSPKLTQKDKEWLYKELKHDDFYF